MSKAPANKNATKGKETAERSNEKDNFQPNPVDEAVRVRKMGMSNKVLVGKIWTTKTLDKLTIRSAFDKMWEPFPNVDVSEIGHYMYSISFDQESHAEKAMENSPWFISNSLLSLQRWGSAKNAYEVSFNKVPFWIQLHDLPLASFSVKSLSAIVTRIGEVLELEIPVVLGKVIRSFARDRVIVDIAKPVWAGCWISIGDDSKQWVPFKYEGLKGLCFNCGLLGHDQDLCKSPKIMASFNIKKPKFGPFLSGSVPRPLACIVKELKEFQTGFIRKPALSGRTENFADFDRTNSEGEEDGREAQDYVGPSKGTDLNAVIRKGLDKIHTEALKVGSEAGREGVVIGEEGSRQCVEPYLSENFEIIDLTNGIKGGFTETFLLMPNSVGSEEMNQSYLRPVIIKYPISQAQEKRGPTEVSVIRGEKGISGIIEEQDKRDAASQAYNLVFPEDGPVRV